MDIMNMAAAFAQAVSDNPVNGGLGLLPAASPIAEEVHFFHDVVLMPVITGISVLVLALIVWVALRYNARANPTPRRFSHNTLVEIIWTGVPILILLYISVFSFELLFNEGITPDGKRVIVAGDGQTREFAFPNDFAERRRVARPEHIQVFAAQGDTMQRLDRDEYELAGLGEETVTVALSAAPAAGSRLIIEGGRSRVGGGPNKRIALAPTMTLKINGYQWGWSYAYPDFGDFEYASNMLPADQTTPELYRFAVDNRVVVPVGETVRVTTTARDVIHSWAMPNFAIKIDAVPGRINETWFRADREGVFYGQCSEICGIKHSFMPIAVEVVSRPAFEAWVDSQRLTAGLDPMFETTRDETRFAALSSAAAE